MQHAYKSFVKCLYCLNDFIIVLWFWSIGWFKGTIYVFSIRRLSRHWSTFVLVWNAVFQDTEILRICKFIVFVFSKKHFWNEIIHILSSTSLLTENKGALVGKCRVQRSNCYSVYYSNKFVSTYTLKHTLRYLARAHLPWCSVSAGIRAGF